MRTHIRIGIAGTISLLLIAAGVLIASHTQAPARAGSDNTSRVLEVRSYNLKPGTRSRFHERFIKEALPMLQRWKVEVIAYGPSLHDADSYYLMCAFPGVAERQKSEDAFYGSDEWKTGPREAVLADIESYTTVVIRADNATLRGLGSSVGTPSAREPVMDSSGD